MAENVKYVRIACQSGLSVLLSDLQPLQGDMKILTQENGDKLAELILTQGFSAPFNVWKGILDVKYRILDGHQRYKTLIRLQNDGYHIPRLPANLVDASSLQEAREKLLSMASQFGTFTARGTEEFLKIVDTDAASASQRFSLPRLRISKSKPVDISLNKPAAPEVKHVVIITCSDSNHQYESYQKILSMGYNCRMTST